MLWSLSLVLVVVVLDSLAVFRSSKHLTASRSPSHSKTGQYYQSTDSLDRSSRDNENLSSGRPRLGSNLRLSIPQTGLGRVGTDRIGGVGLDGSQVD